MQKQRGVGLIEILVTILVIAIGLLGLAGLQSAGMKNANNSHHRALATIAAYDMAERMRTNPTGVKAGSYDALTVNKNTSACSGSEKGVALDVCEWAQSLKSSFPEGFVGTVSLNGSEHWIEISWTELETLAEGAKAPDFELRTKIYSP